MTIESLLLSMAVAIAAGLVGCFAVMRRMTLAADPLSHIALPGIGMALALHIHPIFGAVTMLFFGAFLVWALEDRARAATETMIGVVFSAALAVGALMSSGEDLVEALFGGAGALSRSEIMFGYVAVASIILFFITQKNRLVIMLVSPDLASTAGINVRRLNFLYLQMFALAIALGLRYSGVLLMGALIIIPAATAKGLARNLNSMLWMAISFAIAATLLGTWMAGRLHRETGPLIVTVAAAMFFLSLLRPRPDS
jgi:ABC-type Mn2+/Zn2+ transport system permease subunit